MNKIKLYMVFVSDSNERELVRMAGKLWMSAMNNDKKPSDDGSEDSGASLWFSIVDTAVFHPALRFNYQSLIYLCHYFNIKVNIYITK